MCLCSIYVQYAKPWPHSNIRYCHLSVHAFTSRYDSTLLGHVFFTPKMLKVHEDASNVHMEKYQIQLPYTQCACLLTYIGTESLIGFIHVATSE